MKYFRVPQELDGKQVYSPKSRSYISLVGEELYTQKECERYGFNTKKLQEIEISRKKTYWFFGARFELTV